MTLSRSGIARRRLIHPQDGLPCHLRYATFVAHLPLLIKIIGRLKVNLYKLYDFFTQDRLQVPTILRFHLLASAAAASAATVSAAAATAATGFFWIHIFVSIRVRSSSAGTAVYAQAHSVKNERRNCNASGLARQ